MTKSDFWQMNLIHQKSDLSHNEIYEKKNEKTKKNKKNTTKKNNLCSFPLQVPSSVYTIVVPGFVH